jgi:glycerol-3-phosphate dehydrogenase
MSTLGTREAVWAELAAQREPLDVLVVGGGITGAAILREAARQGLRATLVEQRDFAWGTSSRSSKMVHGGLRYIMLGHIALTRHSAQERERLIREAPGLVERTTYLFPVRKGAFPGRFAFAGLLALYDHLAGMRTRGWADATAVLRRAPGLREDGLRGAAFYTDAITDDARLVLRVLQEAVADGGRALNYATARTLLRDAAGKVQGVELEDGASGARIAVRARVVINATGAWVDELREPVAHERTIRRLRGSHLVVPSARLNVQDALTLFHPEDRRATFIFPWEGCTVIGTTDLDHAEPLDTDPGIAQQEVDYLLALANREFPQARLTEDDVLSTWAGVRPVISKDRSKDPSKETRDHKVWIDQGLLSVSGGKLTTFRLIARDALRAALPLLGLQHLSQPGEEVFTPCATQPAALGLADPEQARCLLGRFGAHAPGLLAAAPAAEHAPLAGTRFCAAELRWACRNEQVLHLDDLLLRRTRIGSLLPEGGEAVLPVAGAICRAELGWSDAQWQAEVARYRALWRSAYALPRARA